MNTLGIFVLVLLALFFGGCAVTAFVFTSLDSTLAFVGAAALVLCFGCVMWIRALLRVRTDDTLGSRGPYDDKTPPPENDQ